MFFCSAEHFAQLVGHILVPVPPPPPDQPQLLLWQCRMKNDEDEDEERRLTCTALLPGSSLAAVTRSASALSASPRLR